MLSWHVFVSRFRWNKFQPVAVQLWTNRNYGRNSQFKRYAYRAMYFSWNSQTNTNNAQGTLESFVTNLEYFRATFPVAEEAKQILHPTALENGSCTMMFMLNLADPEWLSVDCDRKLATDTICYKAKSNTSTFHSISFQELTSHTCTQRAIMKGQHCYLFVWFNHADIDENKNFTSSVNKSDSTWRNMKLETIKRFNFLFAAVSHTTFTAISYERSDKTIVKQHTYKRIWFEIFEEIGIVQKSKAKGYRILTQPVKESIVQGVNTFMCRNGEVIASLYVLDGESDCFRQNSEGSGSDEMCVVNAELCPLRCVSQNCKCSPLHFHTVDGSCVSYNLSFDHSRHAAFAKSSCFFKCTETHMIDHSMVNDLVSDCSVSGNDEPMYKEILVKFTYFPCEKPAEIPCLLGHAKCYNISDICIYKLGKFNTLIPCRTGSHLESCKGFECNTNFKCPKYYCIPWSYICSGIWDCPDGSDESQTHSCGSNRNCPTLFKCKASQICLHITNICDGIFDCPMWDDEVMCILENYDCPLNCVCLNLAISCIGVTFSTRLLKPIPFQSYHIVHTNMKHFYFLPQNPLLIHLNVSRNNIMKVCYTLNDHPNVQSVDFSANYARKLLMLCFSNMTSLKCVSVRNNSLVFVEERSFFNLSQIQLIDLSVNRLQSLPQHSFVNLVQLITLNVTLNPLHNIGTNAFAHLVSLEIVTSFLPVCCTVPSGVLCTTYPTAHLFDTSCSRLFPSVSLKVLFPVVYFFLITLNVICLKQHVRQEIQDKSWGTLNKTKPALGSYEVIVVVINYSSILLGSYLMILWAADQYFDENFKLREYLWNSSELCFVAFTLHFWCSFALPLSFFILAFARLMITKYPMTSKFKSGANVRKYVIFYVTILSNVSAASTIYLKVNRKVLSKMCSPFVTQSSFIFEANMFTLSVTILHVVVSVSLLVLYSMLFDILKKHQASVKNRNFQKGNQQVLFRSIMLNFPNILCWLPSSAVHLYFLFFFALDSEVISWSTVIILPTSCIFNPIFFSVTHKGQKLNPNLTTNQSKERNKIVSEDM